uniref:Uncharacterized protein n=1 Tax=Rhizophora mucronata TaxID=61149 RepID=A0A2P2QUG5_RHIMU
MNKECIDDRKYNLAADLLSLIYSFSTSDKIGTCDNQGMQIHFLWEVRLEWCHYIDHMAA